MRLQRILANKLKNKTCKECNKNPKENGSSRCNECSENYKNSNYRD